ncbi:hypothetical protein GGI25_005474 [Coemansia spiralis]|uniref:Uncharacterized protein n=2 Tax=Coemansia TaxID=4863 RepID=A0A9W8KVP8_9FUNG|nr:hypothetical protein EDC05_005508 [Coemansia umbellata]KAJ2619546.1 hypothetical protein GGI26_005746 [Coemansia sp. RSA 1358]KAJ2671510.1 hypothetical protein GGI25_005474 [Coemansia spiralis]
MEQQQNNRSNKDDIQAPSLDTGYSGATVIQQANSISPNNNGASQAQQVYQNSYVPRVLSPHQQYMFPQSQYQQQGQATQGQNGQMLQQTEGKMEGQPQRQMEGQQQGQPQEQHQQQKQQIQEQQPPIDAYNNGPAKWQQTMHPLYHAQSATAIPLPQLYAGNQQGYSQANTRPQYNPYVPNHETVTHHTNSSPPLALPPLSAPSLANRMWPKEQSIRPVQYKEKKNGYQPRNFLTCLKDSLQNVSISDLVPIATLLAATFLHHYRHWSSDRLVPYKQPTWVKYVKNTIYAYNTYGFLKTNNLLSTMGKRGLEAVGTRNISGNASGVNSTSLLPLLAAGTQVRGWDASRSLHATEPKDMPMAMDSILSSLFGTQAGGAAKGMQDYESAAYGQPGVLAGFNDSYAVQRAVAEHYFHHIYFKNMDLRHASAQAMAGAAAMKVLQSENKLGSMVFADPSAPADLQHDQIVMGIVMSEVNDILERKRQMCVLGGDETLEGVGRIALATIVKIKIDEETVQSMHNNNVQRNSSSEYRYSDRHTSRQYGSTRRSRHDYTFDNILY